MSPSTRVRAALLVASVSLASCGGGNGASPIVQAPASVPARDAAAPPTPAAAAISPAGPQAPAACPPGVRDARASMRRQRALALIVTELQQLEALFRVTDPMSRDRPLIVRRLAEDYVELENVALREKGEAEVRGDALAQTDAAEARRLQAMATSRKLTMDRSRKSAITYYTILVTDYSGQPSPRFPSNPPPADPQLDEVYYDLGYEYEQAGDTANARRVYFALISKAPSSRYVPDAYLAFGELFFDEAMSDPTKWELAKQAYIEVTTRPPPDNRAYGYAWYKLAYVFWNQGDLANAREAFQKVIDFGARFSQLPGAATLGDEGRKGLAATGGG